MAQALTLPESWAADLALATPLTPVGDVAGLRHLPSEWQTIDDIVLEDRLIDHVVVGPNGVFAVSFDTNLTPATIEWDGLYRNGVRVTTPVKNALLAAHDLRQRVGHRLFAYPLLVAAIEGSSAQLDRLGVVPGHRIPEAIWSHPGAPLTRSERTEIAWTLQALTR